MKNKVPKQVSDNEDLGFGSKWTNRVGRFIKPDGEFNIIKSGGNWRDLHLYQILVTMSWGRFFLVVLAFYIAVNAFFGFLHLLVGIETLTTEASTSFWDNFSQAFFFSVQTFTTVGYGSISPMGILANIVAAMCALVGLMSFALATGLFFARFSRPTAKVRFSKNALIAPYNGGKGFMFRIVNGRKSQLIDLFIQATFSWIETNEKGVQNRRYQRLDLEREKVFLFPLNWTIVHPIDEKSPFYQADSKNMQEIDAEILIILTAYDDTFAQQVHTKISYTADQLINNAKFQPMYYTDNEGRTVLEMDKLSSFEVLED
jgi:inward rectifier potassium channel